MERKGYSSDFVGEGIHLPLPTFSPELQGVAYKHADLYQGHYFSYINYSVAMNTATRQLIVAASNIDQKQRHSVPRRGSKRWETDTRLDDQLQLDNKFYQDNPWDRGHMVQRDNNSWGESFQFARRASNDTFYYTNASFQHSNYNQDEWLELEKHFGDFKEDLNDRLTIFTGPIHLDHDRYYSRRWHEAVRIPSAFFKIICYIDKQKQFQTRAFMIFQDDETLMDKSGRKSMNFKKYQVSVNEIEELTGLEFDAKMADSNPVYYHLDSVKDDGREEEIEHLPERIPITKEDDLVTKLEDPRTTSEATTENRCAAICAAMVNPTGRDEHLREWVSVINLGENPLDLTDWKILDQREREIGLSGTLESGEAKKFMMKDFDNPVRLTNTGGSLTLMAKGGVAMDHVVWGKQNTDLKLKEGLAIRF